MESTIQGVLAYLATKQQFLSDAPEIEDQIRHAVQRGLGLNIRPGSSEYQAWHNSLGNAMFHVVNTPRIPEDAGIAIECRINGRSQRIDFMIAGKDEHGAKNLVIVELKQWSSVQHSELRDCVRTIVGRGVHDLTHPSYQAWSYARQMTDFYEVVDVQSISLCTPVPICTTAGIEAFSSMRTRHRTLPVPRSSSKESTSNFRRTSSSEFSQDRASSC